MININMLRFCARYLPQFQHGCFVCASYLRRMVMFKNEPVI